MLQSVSHILVTFYMLMIITIYSIYDLKKKMFFKFSILPEVQKTLINILLPDSCCLEQILMNHILML